MKSLNIVNLYLGMSKLKLKINVNLLQLLCIVVSVVLHGEFERFGGFCVDCYFSFHNNWSRFTFILSFNFHIPRYKFTILRLFNILPYISLYFKQTSRLAACVGALCTRADKFALPNRLAWILFLVHTRLLHSSQNAVYVTLSKELVKLLYSLERPINALNDKRSELRFCSKSIFGNKIYV